MSSRQQRGGFGRRVVVNTPSNRTTGATLNERFTQLKRQASISYAATTINRRVAGNVRSTRGRFTSVMSRRTGHAPAARAIVSAGRPRGGARSAGAPRRGARHTVVGRNTVFRRSDTTGRRGRGGRGGRGGRDRKPVNKDDLDKDLESYMGGSKKFLDSELDKMQTERSS